MKYRVKEVKKDRAHYFLAQKKTLGIWWNLSYSGFDLPSFSPPSEDNSFDVDTSTTIYSGFKEFESKKQAEFIIEEDRRKIEPTIIEIHKL